MKVLIVGGGAREHAVSKALKKNPAVKLYSVMKNRNPGIMRLCEEVSHHDELDTTRTAEFAAKMGVDFAFVGPEAPLAAGCADVLENAGIPCIGPKAVLARIESDKEFMRGLLDKYNIPCNLRHKTFDSVSEASSYLDSVGCDVAVKPVGLTGGKGVKVMGEQLSNVDDAKAYVREVIEGGIGGGKVIIEEKAVGEEFTLMAFVDGENIALMPAVQDHKRAFVGDTGHNTGGMGSYSDSNHLLPFLSESVVEEAGRVIKETVRALKKETGEKYKGILYGQFMLGRDLKVIEFNCRFGDPEAMNVLSILESDLAGVCQDIVRGRLGDVKFSGQATVCKYIVPEGYGVKSTAGQRLTIDEEKIKSLGAVLYYAAVNEEAGEIFTTSSRSVGVIGIADTISEAERICEEAVESVRGEHIYHRRDIGTSGLIEKKLDGLKGLR
ncbi:phosphoribosylamine--glycine ligase [archaeon BMS3Abin16]|nr:phosphoribosylamine--glycine ligase [archaeon BMS3Abin16]